jgi:ATP-dependent Clp protease ATP-binding subunit ClpX
MSDTIKNLDQYIPDDDIADEDDYYDYEAKYNAKYKHKNYLKKNNVISLPASKKINCLEIYQEVTKNVIGQDEQIKSIISILIRNNITNNEYFKSNIFLIGGTGNGKSETIKQIAKKLEIPYVLEDSSKYTQEGYVGDSVENSVVKLITTAGNDIKKAEHGIIIFDEIDKKTDNGDRSGVSTTSVQDSLLKMLEGTVMHTPKGTINTEHITFVLIGACENTFEERKKRLSGKGKIGFTDNKNNVSNEINNPNFIPQDLISSGFKSEFVGRIDSIIEFNPMSIEMAEEIINKSNISIFNFYINELEKLNVRILMNREEIVSEIAKRAIQLKTGARGIRQIVVKMFEKIYSEVIISDNPNGTLYECIITKELVYDNSKFKLCKKKLQN